MDEIIEKVKKTPIEVTLQIDDEGYTTSKKLYKWLELDQSHYSRWCRNNILENPFAESGIDYSPCGAGKGKGNFAEDYRLSADFAKKLSVMQKSERGEEARVYFLGCEKVLSKLAEQKHKTEIERVKGITVRQVLTEAIQYSGENERTHGHAYSLYTDLIYKSAFGKNARQLREEYGITKQEDLRDCFSLEELEWVKSVEMVVSGLVNCGWGYGEIKDFIINQPKRLIPCGTADKEREDNSNEND